MTKLKKVNHVPLWLLVILAAASIPAAYDVGIFLWKLLPMELLRNDSAAQYAFSDLWNFNVWRMLSMLALEFVAIQLCMARAFKRDQAQNPLVVLALSIGAKEWLASPKKQFKMLGENLIQKIVWLSAAFVVVFISFTGDNAIQIYGTLIGLCIFLAILWKKTRLLWWDRESTAHYMATGVAPFITTTALAWHHGIVAAALTFVFYATGLLVLMLVAHVSIGAPNQEEVEEAADISRPPELLVEAATGSETETRPKPINFYMTTVVDQSGSIPNEAMSAALEEFVEVVSAHPFAYLLRIRRINYSGTVQEAGPFTSIKDFDTSSSSDGTTATNCAIKYSCSFAPEKNASNSIVLVTDGEQNAGTTSDEAASQSRQTWEKKGGNIAGICIGSGSRTMERLGIKNYATVHGDSKEAMKEHIKKVANGVLGTLDEAAKGKISKQFRLA